MRVSKKIIIILSCFILSALPVVFIHDNIKEDETTQEDLVKTKVIDNSINNLKQTSTKKEIEKIYNTKEKTFSVVNKYVNDKINPIIGVSENNKPVIKPILPILPPIELPNTLPVPELPSIDNPVVDDKVEKPVIPVEKPTEKPEIQPVPPIEKPVVPTPPIEKPVEKPKPIPPVEKPVEKPVVKPNQDFNVASYQQQVLNLVNTERANAGLNTLSLDNTLQSSAMAKSKDMAEKGYFDHTSPTYGSVSNMLKQFGVSYRYNGENIAKGQSTPQSVMNSWMGSSGHKANILSPNFTHLGVGVYKNNNGQICWTQQFIGR